MTGLSSRIADHARTLHGLQGSGRCADAPKAGVARRAARSREDVCPGGLSRRFVQEDPGGAWHCQCGSRLWSSSRAQLLASCALAAPRRLGVQPDDGLWRAEGPGGHCCAHGACGVQPPVPWSPSACLRCRYRGTVSMETCPAAQTFATERNVKSPMAHH